MRYEQIYDGDWRGLPRFLKIRCCHCGLIHKWNLRFKKNILQVQIVVDKRATAATRRRKAGWLCKKGK